MVPTDVLRLIVLAAAVPAIGCTQPVKTPCVLEVAAHNPAGLEVSASIRSVSPEGMPGNLLDLGDDLRSALGRNELGRFFLGIAVEGQRVFFPRDLADHMIPIQIVVSGEGGGSTLATVTLTHCRQRVSLFVDVENPPDARFVSFIQGKLVGCRLTGDWWLRGMPLFQAEVYPYLEGHVTTEDGLFWIQASEPVRHVLVFGRGQEPLFTTAIDVPLSPIGVGQDIALGNVDIGSSCPEEDRLQERRKRTGDSQPKQ